MDDGFRARVRFLSCAIALVLVGEAVGSGDGLARWRRFFLEAFLPRRTRP